MPRSPACLLVLLASSSAGCFDSVVLDPNSTVDEAAILAVVSSGRFRTADTFRRVNASAFPSAVAGNSMINVYISADAIAAYEAADPSTTGSNTTIPVGTLIVREVDDASLAAQEITLMYRGPHGYNPDLGDFWFGVTDPSGTPIVKDGVKQTGRLTACYSCHIPRAGDGWIFGVPPLDRTSTTPAPAPAPDGGVADGDALDGGDTVKPTITSTADAGTVLANPTPPDLTPPVFAGLTTATKLDATHCRVGWTAATDNVSPATALVYNVFAAQQGSAISYAKATSYSTPGATTLDVQLQAGHRWDLAARAVDAAGNLDANTAIVTCDLR